MEPSRLTRLSDALERMYLHFWRRFTPPRVAGLTQVALGVTVELSSSLGTVAKMRALFGVTWWYSVLTVLAGLWLLVRRPSVEAFQFLTLPMVFFLFMACVSVIERWLESSAGNLAPLAFYTGYLLLLHGTFALLNGEDHAD